MPTADPYDRHRRRHRVFGLLAGAVLGGLVAAQSAVNGRLSDELGGGAAGAMVAAWVNFASGFVALCAVVALVPAGRRGLRRIWAGVRHSGARDASRVRSGGLRPYELLGGIAGAALVASQCLTVPVIGVALFTVAVVAGATGSALAVDHQGLGPAGHRRVTPTRAIGAAMTLGAVVLAVSGRLDTGTAAWLAILPLIAGAGTSWQQAANGRVAVQAGSPMVATWVNFAGGLVTITLLAAVVLAVAAPAEPLPPLDGEHWWLYTGALVGIAFITTSAVVVRILGVLLLGLAVVAGQLVTAVALDALLADAPDVDLATLVGSALVLAGVAVASLPARRRSPATAG